MVTAVGALHSCVNKASPLFMGKVSRQQIYYTCLIFSKKIGFIVPCILSPTDTICMKWQSLYSGKIIKRIFQNVVRRQFAWNDKAYFLGKNKKTYFKYHLLKYLPRMLRVNVRHSFWSTKNISLRLQLDIMYTPCSSIIYSENKDMYRDMLSNRFSECFRILNLFLICPFVSINLW